MYFLGFHTDKMATGQYFQWAPLVITIIVLWLALKAIREENEGHYLTYGQGVGAGTLICLFSGLMSAVYTYLHFKFINPNFTDYQVEFMRGKWAAKGLTDAQMDQAETMMRKFSGPGIYAIAHPVYRTVLWRAGFAGDRRHPQAQPARRRQGDRLKANRGRAFTRPRHVAYTPARLKPRLIVYSGRCAAAWPAAPWSG